MQLKIKTIHVSEKEIYSPSRQGSEYLIQFNVRLLCGAERCRGATGLGSVTNTCRCALRRVPKCCITQSKLNNKVSRT